MRRSNLILLASALLSIVACHPKGDRFTVEGTVLEADGKTMYLDHMALNQVETIDSVKLDQKGSFKFSSQAPADCFDFYRLRIDGKYINLIVDSAQSITVNAALPSMQIAYEVEGSDNSVRLKEMVIRQMELLQDLRRTSELYSGPQVGIRQEKINELVDVFKSEISYGYIFPDPASACAYYALFMSINGQMIFSPGASRQDAKCFAAVATQMDMLYPEAVRTEHLHNLALKSMLRTAPAAPASEETVKMLENLVSESGLVEIELPDLNGRIHKLSDLKGKVVLLDFTAYKTDYSANYNLAMRTLYDKYASQGFTIYQVSVDADEHFWRTSAANLPWTCVYDENSLESTYLKLYNVGALPTAFLINRDGEVVDRPEEQSELDAKIAELLK